MNMSLLDVKHSPNKKYICILFQNGIITDEIFSQLTAELDQALTDFKLIG